MLTKMALRMPNSLMLNGTRAMSTLSHLGMYNPYENDPKKNKYQEP